MAEVGYSRENMGFLTLTPDSMLYHYTSAEGLVGILNGEAWVTERHFLNDPSEFSVATDVFLEVAEKHIHDKERLARFRKAILNEAARCERFGELGEDLAFSGYYVMSFCLEDDSALLWSEYSDFQGYCLGVELGSLIDSFGANRIYMHGKVIYDHDVQVELIEKVVQGEYIDSPRFPELNSWDDFDEPRSEDAKYIISFLNLDCSTYNMFFKKQCFEGEQEYRVVFSHIHDGGRVGPEERYPVDFRIKDGMLIPFVKMPFDAMGSVKSITIGAKNTSDIAGVGLRYFLRSKNMSVDVRKSGIPLRY